MKNQNQAQAEQPEIKLQAGHRYLVRDPQTRIGYGEMFEIKVVEVSPKGMVKVKFLIDDGGTAWKSPDDFEIIECLDQCLTSLRQQQ